MLLCRTYRDTRLVVVGLMTLALLLWLPAMSFAHAVPMSAQPVVSAEQNQAGGQGHTADHCCHEQAACASALILVESSAPAAPAALRLVRVEQRPMRMVSFQPGADPPPPRV